MYLAEACKERFIVSSEIPELMSEEISMAGLGEFSQGYSVERREPEIHTILFTLEGAVAYRRLMAFTTFNQIL